MTVTHEIKRLDKGTSCADETKDKRCGYLREGAKVKIYPQLTVKDQSVPRFGHLQKDS
jgi:hypothetical protein